MTLRTTINLLLHIPLAIACGWTHATWLFLPFFVVLSSMPPTRFVWYRPFFVVAGFNLAALFTGATLEDMMTFSAVGAFFFFSCHAYLNLVGNLVGERDQHLRELRAAHRQVVTQEKMAAIGHIAAGVAHEINNPMCFVTANVQSLLEEMGEASEMPAFLQDYRDAILPETLDGIRRVNSIVDDLRRFARGEPETFVSFDVVHEVEAAIRMARTQVKPSQTLELHAPATLPIQGSPRQMCQVVLNLVINGLQAIPDDGAVVVNLSSAENGQCQIAVRDNGAGIAEETRRRLFEPFFSTKTRGGSGLGLGLSVAYGIVKSHQGTIEVDSEVGKGSCFRILLPTSGPTLVSPTAGRAAARPPGSAPLLAVARPPAPARTPGASS